MVNMGRGTTPPADNLDLSVLFGREPELVLACLQGLPPDAIDEAARIYELARQAVDRAPGHADLLYYTSLAAERAGVPGEAYALAARALEINPNYTDALVHAARLALAQGELQRAQSQLEHVLTLGFDYPDVHVLLGDVHKRNGEWKQARQSYERALTLNPTLVGARAGLSSLPEHQSSGKDHELSA